MKMYKGFNENLQCTPNGKVFQYEIGKTYETDNADLCNEGFHACESPLNVFNYYPPTNSRFCEVELDGVTDQHGDDSNRCGKKITVGAEIGVPGLVKAHVEYTKHKAESGKNGGNWSNLAGGYGSNLVGGNWSNLAGGYGSDLAGGNWSNLAGGDGSLIVARNGSKAKAGMNSVIVLAEFDNEGVPACVRVEIVDGKKIKPDTWYTLKDGEFVEVKDE